MTNRLLVLAGLLGFLLSPSVRGEEALYSYTGAVDNIIENFSPPCVIGPCADFPTGSRVTGHFTTGVPLASNLNGVNVYPQVTSFYFTDGLNAYSNVDPNIRVYAFHVSTDASGNIVLALGDVISLELWQTGLSPHVIGNRFALLDIFSAGNGGYNNDICGIVQASPIGVPDTCTSQSQDASTSSAAATTPGTWSKVLVPFAPIPTLSVWALALLSLGIAGLAAMGRRTLS